MPLAARRIAARSALIVLCALILGGCGGGDAQPNVLLIVLDTVRDDATALGGDTCGLTPSLEAFATDGTVFTHAWSTAPWTVPSHASMFTGQLSAVHGCTHRRTRLDSTWPTTAELLSGSGYQTAAFFSNPWLADRTTKLLRGFDVKAETSAAGDDPAAVHRGDQGGRGTLAAFGDWLTGRAPDRPFFAFVNFLEAHHPYDPPADVRNELLPDLPTDDLVTSEWVMDHQAGLHERGSVDWTRVRDLYDGDVRSVDDLLEGLLGALEAEGVLDDTVVIVTSDHGEMLGEHDLVAHQFSLHEPLIAVPLVIRAPGRLDAGQRDDPVMLTDLFATVLDMAGVADAPVRTHSRSLLDGPADAGRPLIAEYYRPNDTLMGALRQLNPELDTALLGRTLRTIRIGDVRLTVDDGGRAELHDLAADPGQERNLSRRRLRDVRALRNLLDHALESATAPEGEVEIDEATRRQLESLGYIH